MSVTDNSQALKFRVNPDYVLRDICGEYAIIPVGEECLIANAVMTPNESAAFNGAKIRINTFCLIFLRQGVLGQSFL